MARQHGRLHAHHLLHQLGVLRWQQSAIISGSWRNACLRASNTISSAMQKSTHLVEQEDGLAVALVLLKPRHLLCVQLCVGSYYRQQQVGQAGRWRQQVVGSSHPVNASKACCPRLPQDPYVVSLPPLVNLVNLVVSTTEKLEWLYHALLKSFAPLLTSCLPPCKHAFTHASIPLPLLPKAPLLSP